MGLAARFKLVAPVMVSGLAVVMVVVAVVVMVVVVVVVVVGYYGVRSHYSQQMVWAARGGTKRRSLNTRSIELLISDGAMTFVLPKATTTRHPNHNECGEY